MIQKKLPKVLFFLIAIVLVGCAKKEGCTDRNAENYDPSAERENGTCILQRTKFIALYQVNETNTRDGQISYIARIRAANDNLYDVFVDNLSNRFSNIRARINGNQIQLYTTEFPISNMKYQGGGSIVGNNLNLQFTSTRFSVIPNEVINHVAFFVK